MLDDPGLRYAASLLGDVFLGYVTGRSRDEIVDRVNGDLDALPEPSEEALAGTLHMALQWVPVPTPDPPLIPDGGRPDGSPQDRMRRFGWVDMDRAHSFANIVRLSLDADLPPVPLDLDPAEEAIAHAAVDYYPVTLIPMPHPERPSGDLPILSHARAEVFEQAIRADGSITPLTEATDFIWTSAPSAGFQAPTEARVMGLIVANAEQRVRMFADSAPEAFITACVEGLRTVRSLCHRSEAEVPALVGFSHLSVPEGTLLDGPGGGRIRPAHDADLRIPGASPASLVLETIYPLRLAIGPLPPTDTRFLEGRARTGKDADVVGLAGLLATRRSDAKGVPRQTWVKVFDPLTPFTGMFKEATPGLPPVTIGSDEADEMSRWVQTIERSYRPSIRVAVERCISGCGERQKPEDSLVDLVIALESLFGGTSGELRLRISMALAWLLGEEPEDRTTIQRDAKKAYDIRSKIVHGAQVLGEEPVQGRELAERLLLDALERLFTVRPELIADQERSLKLILGR
jgi:hypothetical protein